MIHLLQTMYVVAKATNDRMCVFIYYKHRLKTTYYILTSFLLLLTFQENFSNMQTYQEFIHASSFVHLFYLVFVTLTENKSYICSTQFSKNIPELT